MLAEIEILQCGCDLIRLLHARTQWPATDQHQNVARVDAARLDGRHRRWFRQKNASRSTLAIDAVRIDDARIDRGALDHSTERREVTAWKTDGRSQAPARRSFGIANYILGIDAVAMLELFAKALAALRGFPPIKHAADRLSGNGQRFGFKQPRAPQMEHDFGHRTGEEYLHGRVVHRAIGKTVNNTRHSRVDARPIFGGRLAQTGGMRASGEMQDQICGAAESRMHDHTDRKSTRRH